MYTDYYIYPLGKNSPHVRSVGGVNWSDDVMALNAIYYF